jgi:hypothetical protein
MVHRLRDLCDSTHSVDRQMQTFLHHLEELLESLELLELRRSQWIRFEEGNDRRTKIVRPEDRVHNEIFPVVVSPRVAVEPSAPEEVLDEPQDVGTSLSLDNNETRLHLPSELHLRARMDWTAKTTFTVDEADDPLLDSWPFLLIARTRRIFTGHVPTIPGGSDMAGTAGYSGVPAYSQLHITPSPA